MKTIILTSLLFFLSIFYVSGQNYAPIEDVDIIKKYDVVLKNLYPNTPTPLTIKKVYKVDDKHTAIGYLQNNKYSEVVVNDATKDMLIVLSSIEIAPQKKPIVYDVWKKDYADEWSLDKMLHAKTPYGDHYYVAVMKQNSGKSNEKWKRVFYDNMGHLQNSPF